MTTRMMFAVATAALLGAGAASADENAVGKDLYAESCKNCHGPTAKGMASFPKLSDKSAEHITMRLEQYRAGEMVGPNSALMQPVAAELSDDEIAAVAEYITTNFGPKIPASETKTDAPAGAGKPEASKDAAEPAEDKASGAVEEKTGDQAGHGAEASKSAPKRDMATDTAHGSSTGTAQDAASDKTETAGTSGDAAAPSGDAAAPADVDIAAGEEIYQGNCKNCHGPTAKGMASFPKLSDKSAEHITMRLEQYRADEKVGPNSALMQPIASDLSDEDIANIAAYITTNFN